MVPSFIYKVLNKIKRNRSFQQRTLFFTVILLSLLVIGCVALYMGSSEPKKPLSTIKPGKVNYISNGAQSLKMEELWVDKIEKERKLLQTRVDQLESIVKDLAQQKIANDIQKAAINSHQDAPKNTLDHLNGQFPDDIFQARQQLALSQQQGQGPQPSQGLVDSPTIPSAKVPPQKPEIKKITFQLNQTNSKRIGKTVDHYVPAGSFAQGVLASGVVASTSVGASANPQPIHIQLTNLGTLPRRFRTDIKECFVIGSSYGDLASERVFMRLEKLSCVERKTGEVIELTVDGYVTGEDGANGVRGILVDRSGPAMRNAFIGGFVGGVGNFFTSQQQTPLSIVGGGVANINPMTSQHLLQAGAGKGLGNAMEKFADFYIKRAEQLQPVLEVEAGRVLDVVFKSGFDMAQTIYRRAIMGENDRERREIALQSRETNPGYHPINTPTNSQGGSYDQNNLATQ